MKIDSNRPSLDHAALQRLERAAADAPKQATTATRAASGDTVQVSADASLANTTIRAVHDAPNVRTDLVERMRALLASGGLGNDAGQLADSLIATMTEKTGITDNK